MAPPDDVHGRGQAARRAARRAALRLVAGEPGAIWFERQRTTTFGTVVDCTTW